MQPKRYIITAALPYANGPLHIGHLAGAYLSSDIFARYLRLMGKDVAFVCGSDEYGAAITIRAKKEGTTPREIVDKNHAIIKDSFEKLGISLDIYHRTTEPIHTETAQDFFKTVYDKNTFIEETTEQYFDEETQQFLADRYIIGTCPNCSNEEAYGDQCEKCGSTLSPTELINPRSTLSGATPVLKTTKHWYIPLGGESEVGSENEAWLKDWIIEGNGRTQKWKNNVLGQAKSWLQEGLRPRSITRDLDWGIPVPLETEDAKGKVLYVWFDAPIGYISATKQWAADNGKDWKDYWQSEDSQLIHFLGKDNIVFHTIIFPSMLRMHGDYILPTNVPANEFMNLEGRKLSTSKNWAVWVHEYLEDLPNKQDELRYAIIKNMPENKDSEFTWAGFQESVNNELVNNLANFVNRVVVFANKYFDGKTPAYDANATFIGSNNETITAAAELKTLHQKLTELGQNIENYEFRQALTTLMEISSLGNQFLQYNEPWKLYKQEPDSEIIKITVNLGLQFTAALSVACRPFMPFTSDKLRALLNLPAITDKGEFATLLKTLANGNDLVEVGHQISKPNHLFSRITDETVAAQVEKLEANLAASTPKITSYEPVKENCEFDDFMKLDFRTGTITAAEKIKKAKKLLQLTVDLGFEVRTIVSGIAEFYEPENVIGTQVVVVANLGEKKLRGVMSQGMILMAENDEGKLVFVSPESGFGNGFTVR
jgi:methionyl-tRNA synthetase